MWWYMKSITLNKQLTTSESHVLTSLKRDYLTYEKFTIEYIAQKTFSSVSVISRLVRKLGFKNFSEFKQFLTNEKNYTLDAANNTNPLDLKQHVNNIFTSIDHLTLDYMLSLISNPTHKIYLIGFGQSRLATKYFQKHLARFSISSFCLNDVYTLQKMLDFDCEKAIFITFTSSGETPGIVNALKNNRSILKGKTILITSNHQCEIIDYCHKTIVLTTPFFTYQDFEIYAQSVFYTFTDLIFLKYFNQLVNK